MRQVSPKLEAWLENFNFLVNQLAENGFKPNATNAREGLANLTKSLITDIPDIKWIQDDLVEGGEYAVPVRLYHPEPGSALPVLVYYHGGGHMAGSVTVYDPICRKLALAARHIVVAAEYRLAPECPYPAGVNDAYSVIQHVWKTLDSRNVSYSPALSIAGDSGGGALVATVSAKAQFDEQVRIAKQVLIYPSLDYTMASASMDENATGFLLQKAKVAWYFDNYFQNGEDRKLASPLYQQMTSQLPDTLLFTAEFCPLRDEGIAYCKMVEAVGVKVEHHHFTDMIHTYVNMEDLVKEECQITYQKIGQFLNR